MAHTTSSSSAPGPAAARSPTTWRRRASGSCCWNGATGCRASRPTGWPPTSSWTTATSPRTPGPTSTARRSSRRSTTSSAGRRSSTARRSTGCAREDFGELRHHDGLSPAWPISYEQMEPYYTRAEQLYQVHGARGEDPTEPPASAPYPRPPVSPRATHPAALRRPRRGRACTPSTPRAGSCSTRRTCRTAPACAVPTVTASRARCMASPTPRSTPCARRWSIPTSTC